MPEAADLAAYVSVIGGLCALLYKLYTLISRRRKERVEINEQLNKAPLEREHLAATLVDRRIAQLDSIIASQALHIERQDAELSRQDDELRIQYQTIQEQMRQIEAMQLEIHSLRRRVDESVRHTPNGAGTPVDSPDGV